MISKPKNKKSRKNILYLLAATIALLSLAVVFIFIALNHTDNQTEQPASQIKKTDVREVVWGQLSSEQKEQINGTWMDGKVSKVTLNGSMMIGAKDKSYEGKEVYLIDFPTKSNGTSDNMVIYADLRTFDYIGYGLID